MALVRVGQRIGPLPDLLCATLQRQETRVIDQSPGVRRMFHVTCLVGQDPIENGADQFRVFGLERRVDFRIDRV